MNKSNNTLTQQYVKECFSYCPDTGLLTYRHDGSIAGYIFNPYKDLRYYSISINGVKYLAHRLVWLYVYGKFPDNQIDHIDGNGLNNRIDNLRDVTASGNQKNKRLQCNNTSGFNGVRFHKKSNKWMSQIKHNGNYIYLGSFETKLAAAYCRHVADIKYGFHENHGNQR